MKQIILALSLVVMFHSVDAAHLKFVEADVNGIEQAETYLVEQLARDYQFSYQRRGVYGRYFGFMPMVQAKPIFNRVDTLAVSEQNKVFRYYQSLFQTEPEPSWPQVESPSLAQVATALEKPPANISIDEVTSGWWQSESALLPVWKLIITEQTPTQAITSYFFLDATSYKCIGEQGDIPIYQSEVNQLASGLSVDAWLFDPDPKTTLMSDTLDTDVNEGAEIPHAAFSLLELKDLTTENDKLVLSGPYANVVDFNSPDNAVIALEPNQVQSASPDSSSFSQQMAYYHIDAAQRRLQALGYEQNKLIHYTPITVDAQGSSLDQSAYSFYQNRIILGIGGFPDAQDADVIWHEYGHSISLFVNPYHDGADSGAIGEGFSDFFAASHSYRNPQGYSFEPDIMFNWDARANSRRPRSLNDEDARYNADYYYPAHIYVNGVLGDQLWSSPLFQTLKLAAQKYGATAIDDVERFVIEAMYGLGTGVTMNKLALSTLDMANRMYPEKDYADDLQAQFAKHNLLPKFLFIEQATVVEKIQGELSVNFNMTNLSDSPLGNIELAATAVSGVSTQVAPLNHLAPGQSQTIAIPVTLAQAQQCGAAIEMQIRASFDNDIPVISDELVNLSLQIGKASSLEQSASGGLLADAKGSQSGAVNSKGVTNFYLELGEQKVLIDKDFRLQLAISHYDFKQLSIKLISPSGRSVMVWEQGYYPHAEFNFDFPSQIADIDFSEFYGEYFRGQWQLQIVDHKPDFTQPESIPTLNHWQLSQITAYQCASEVLPEPEPEKSGGSMFWFSHLALIVMLAIRKHYKQENV